MKMLVTGGNRGLGLELVKRFSADSISRSTGHDITKSEDLEKIAELSLEYDVFINNAFDGPAGVSWANFGQINLLAKIFDVWKERNKQGTIINIGSVGEQTIVSPVPDFERYRIPKAALKHASLQCTQAFKQNLVKFKTSLLTLDRLDTPLSRSRESWTGNAVDCDVVGNTIEMIYNLPPNTCLGELSLLVDFNYAIQK